MIHAVAGLFAATPDAPRVTKRVGISEHHTATFSESVTVKGQPRLTLRVAVLSLP